MGNPQLKPTETLIVDRREPRERIIRLEAAGFEVSVPDTELESGDILAQPPHLDGKTVGIEVKTTQELLTLVPSGLSSLRQFQRMLDYEHRVLLVVGTYDAHGPGLVRRDSYDRRNMTYGSVQGALFNLQANLGFLVRHTDAEARLGHAVRNIYDFFNGDHVLLSKPRPLTLSHPHAEALAFLMSIPGVGADKAQKIIATYTSMNSALINVDSWDVIDGIGPKTRLQAKQFLERKW